MRDCVQSPLRRQLNQIKKSTSTDKWCNLHQASGHSTSECKLVQSQISKMRSIREPVHAKLNSNSNPSTNPKTNGKQVHFKDNIFNNKKLMSLVQEQGRKFLK
jgi:hypothetical protein